LKQRAVTLLLVIGALVVFYALFFPKPGGLDNAAPPPLSTENGPDGLAGMRQWLVLAHIPVASLRERYEGLDRLTPAGTGNVLITSLPQRLPMNTPEAQALGRWVERGNTLVVLAALDDTPRWAAGAGPELIAELARITRFDFFLRDTSRAASLRSLFGSSTLLVQPRGRHPLLMGVHEVRDVSALPAARWIGSPAAGAAALAIAERRATRADERDALVWVEPRLAGQEIVCAFAAAFSNAQIAQADNARLLANIIAWSRAPAGRVIFDDAHQGLVDFYDPQAFFSDPRLHDTLWWILLLWLVWVLGSQTLRNQEGVARPVDETALIEASGRFYSAQVSTHEAARRLLTNFFDEVHRRLRQTQDGSPPWEWLATQSAVAPATLAALRECQARLAAGGRVNLWQVQNLLAQIRRSIE
jgi:Domain of unknown function (DUF4350)